MKANKFMAIVMMACTIMAVGCTTDPEGNGPDVITIEGAPELSPVEGAWVVAVRFDEVPCNDVYFIGHYANKDGVESNWGLDEGAVKFEQCEGKKTWYQAVIYPVDYYNGETLLAAKGTATGKPVQLQSDGSFDWSGQPALNALQLMDGVNCSMDEENGGEMKFSFFTKEAVDAAIAAFSANEGFDADYFVVSDPVVFATSKGWKVTPCQTYELFEKVTFNLTIPEAVEGGVFLHGPFVDDKWNGLAMTKVDDLHYTIEIANLKEGTEYQYTLAQDNWNEKGLFDKDGECDAANQKVSGAVINDVVTGFAASCEDAE